jgi:hypothetical protein
MVPAPMIPTVWICMEESPLSMNGGKAAVTIVSANRVRFTTAVWQKTQDKKWPQRLFHGRKKLS